MVVLGFGGGGKVALGGILPGFQVGDPFVEDGEGGGGMVLVGGFEGRDAVEGSDLC